MIIFIKIMADSFHIYEFLESYKIKEDLRGAYSVFQKNPYDLITKLDPDTILKFHSRLLDAGMETEADLVYSTAKKHKRIVKFQDSELQDLGETNLEIALELSTNVYNLIINLQDYNRAMQDNIRARRKNTMAMRKTIEALL